MPLVTFRGILVDKLPFKDNTLIIRVLSVDNHIFTGLLKHGKGSDQINRLESAEFTGFVDPSKEFISWRRVERGKELAVSSIKPEFYDQYYFIAEVFRLLVREDLGDEGMYEYILKSIRYFSGQFHPEYHLYFLCGLLHVLGLHPDVKPGQKYFDLREAESTDILPPHPDFVATNLFSPIIVFTNEIQGENVFVNASSRNDFIQLVLRFIQLHRSIKFDLKTLQVLRDLRQ